MTSSGEQNLNGEPSWNAGGLQAPTRAHNSARPVEEGAQDLLHEFVMFLRIGLLTTLGAKRTFDEISTFVKCPAVIRIIFAFFI